MQEQEKFFAGIAFAILTTDARLSPKKQKIIEEVRADKQEFERAKSVHERWYIQAVNSVMGAIGRQMYLNMGRFERRAFLNCLDTSDDDNNLRGGAECVVHAYDKTLHKLEGRRRRKRSTKAHSLKKFITIKKLDQRLDSERLRKLRGNGRTSKKSENAKAKRTKKVRLKNNEYRLTKKAEESSGYQDWLHEYQVKSVSKLPSLMASKDEKSPVKRITTLISTMVKQKPGWKMISDKLKTLNEMNSNSKNQAKYGHKIKDIVTDYDEKYRKKIPFSKRFRNIMPSTENMPKVLKAAFELVNSMEKHTDMFNAKVLSPRFLPIVDNFAGGDTIHLLSPNILPFYKDDSPNSILPLPDVIDSTGLKPDDREAVLELVMEMSGAQQIVEDTFKIFKNNETATLLEDVDQVTNGMEKIFETLKGTFTSRQRRELAQQKFTFMEKKQLDFLYGPEGAFNNTLEWISIDEYSRFGHEDKKRLLMKDLRRIMEDSDGADTVEGSRRRKKRGLEVMAPFSFSPEIMSPAVLGPLILSPNLFSPSILSPEALSPTLISPNIGSPLIISPHMLSPDIMSPTLLSGAILNPYFMSPAVLTESALALDLMSPSFMSKKKRRKR
uniref:ANK_REP_REGION domain-containing protein n=1 Tax=Bursaphelenchus xylophilus TaxID=6326 RepID=A0A1I7S5L8_BURXY